MLMEMKIEGFKLLRDVSISPHERFNAVTGETGAGKSLLIGALKFLLGAKGGDELFAKGEDLVKVSATFDIPQNSPARENLLDENMIEPDETELHVERWKERDGRSRFFIGGRRANLPAGYHYPAWIGQEEQRPRPLSSAPQPAHAARGSLFQVRE